MISVQKLVALRARRQHLSPDAHGKGETDVQHIIRDLQPLPLAPSSRSPYFDSRVDGYQPLWYRELRRAHRIVEGHFVSGQIACVATDDLPLYAAAFRVFCPRSLATEAERFLALLRRLGPLRKSQLQELLGWDVRLFTRVLTALSRSFLIVQMPQDAEWDNPWALMSAAYPMVEHSDWDPLSARGEALRRFVIAFGAASLRHMVEWSGWGAAEVNRALAPLLSGGTLTQLKVKGQPDTLYVPPGDLDELQEQPDLPHFLTALPPNDPFVLPQWSSVIERYRTASLPLCHAVLVMDGEIAGATWGHPRRHYVWIESLNLHPEIEAGDDLFDQALAAIESYVSGGRVPIRIYAPNHDESPRMAKRLERHGYEREIGYYIKTFGRI
ncbi:MAG: winged helix DNA-binding domain-containing protein [Chloroflexi bacterium]|nr:winged helix DNA-binding domain-containing protein [Chloroflexota bacterium]